MLLSSQSSNKPLSTGDVGFPGDTVVKNLPADAEGARDSGSTPGWERSLKVGNGNPL